jgi:hypothetical protein
MSIPLVLMRSEEDGTARDWRHLMLLASDGTARIYQNMKYEFLKEVLNRATKVLAHDFR